MQGNGQPTDVRSYDEWARRSVSRVFDQPDTAPAGSWVWALAGIGSAIVYALLEIARAVRDARR